MIRRAETGGIATLLVLLELVALPYANARPRTAEDSAVNSGETDTCAPNLAGAGYVGGVDVEGNRITPADIGGGTSVDLGRISATPVLVPGRHGRQADVVVQGAEPAKPPCERPPH